MKPEILVGIDLPPASMHRLAEAYILHPAGTAQDLERLRADGGLRTIRAVLTSGAVGLSANLVEAMPQLEIICVSGSSCENIDVGTARRRGIAIVNGPGIDDVSVADHAMALLLAVTRGIAETDRAVRRGEWTQGQRLEQWDGVRRLRPTITGKRLGILGLGQIGQQIAQRAAAGFGMSIAYHNRRPRKGSFHAFHDRLIGLARNCDFLVISCPGGAETRHLVGPAVLGALGNDGYIVNVSAGSIVDTAALIDALKERRIAGAALDVIEGEPNVPAELLAQPNVIVTPRMAGRSPETFRASADLIRANLDAHFAGRPLLTPVV